MCENTRRLPTASTTSVQIRTDFPRTVRTVEHLWIPLSDGCRLAARMWLPDDAERDPVPAILDAVPYRKGDGTAAGDAAWNRYFAGHGYAGVRIDLRGSGDADGLIPDEYTVQEGEDVDEVITWLAEQPWCTGAVGMIGVSWGGFAALQAAARHPPALRGIVPIHASDDRYADDVHYFGGCVLATDMVHWSTCMAAYVGQPPDPAVVGEGWRDAWRERVERMEPWVATWLSHQRRDDYWRQGSACERYAEIGCPVFAVGGWSDGYRDMVLRMVEHVDAPVRGLIGPWGHTGPESGAPGPAIGFLQECVRFFDHALKGADNGFFDEPALVSYLQERIGPVTHCAERPGRWVADPAWPSPNVETRVLPLREPVRRRMRALQLTGLEAGVWCGDGGPADGPGDQRPEDGASICWDLPPLEERLELLGHAATVLELAADRPVAFVGVRLCEVAPDGVSTLIARGVLNLTHREGHDRVVPLVPGEPVTVRVPMQSTSYAVPSGHALRVAVSPTYWPWIWPSPEPVTLTVGEGRLELPVRGASELDGTLRPFGPPESAPGLAKEYARKGTTGRVVHRNLETGSVDMEFPWIDHVHTITDSGTELAERNLVHYRLTEGDPLSATVEVEVEVGLARGDWRTRVVARGEMTCDRERFLVTTSLDAYEGSVRCFARRWSYGIPRDGG
jgi:predicted acyl esterase